MQINYHYQIWAEIPGMDTVVIVKPGFLQAVEVYAKFTRQGLDCALFEVQPQIGNGAAMMKEVSDDADHVIFQRRKNHPVVIPLSVRA